MELTVKQRRILGGFAALVLIFAAVIAVRSRATNNNEVEGSESQQDPLVPVVEAVKTPISNQLLISAEFRPFQEVDVHAKVAGYVKSISVDVGDHVKANQILAVLEIPEIDAELKEADASIRRNTAEVERLRSQIQRAESAHNAAHSNAARLTEVMKSHPNLVAQQEIDDIVAKDKGTEADVDSYRAGLSAAQESLAAAKANQERIASLKAYSRIIAPFDGVVTKRYADTGSMIQAGTSSNTQAMPLVRIAENRKLRLVIPVPESAVPLIHLNAPVQVRVGALNRTFTGKVARFADSVDTQTRTMETEVDVENGSGILKPGMFASAVLVTQHKDSALTLPTQAISRSGDQAFAMVVGPGKKLEQRKLVLGIEAPDRVEVISGIQAGEQAIMGNQTQFQPGQVIQPKPVAQSPAENGKG